MNYELAKQLQDAGFPQGGAGKRIAPSDKIVARRDDFAYAPTLDELIEACGNFGSLSYDLDPAPLWTALDSQDTATGFGATPTEAVARLWLALNHKHD